MRVLLTTDTVGGVWTFTRELTGELLRRGHDVALVSFGREPSSAQQRWADVTCVGAPGRFVYQSSPQPLEWMQSNEQAYDEGAALLLRAISSFVPDVLHLNQFCFGALPSAAPRVVTAHSDVLSWAAVCRPAGLAPSPWLSRYLALVQSGLAGADAVTAPTRWMAEELQTRLPFGPRPQVINNGRTVPLPEDAGGSERALQAVTAGRLWDEGKNTALLREVHAPMPILIAGDQQLEAVHGGDSEASAEGPRLLGALDEPALLALFSSSALYLATSRYEPFGLAPLEAALCGCAVLAHDIAPLREVWEDAALYFRNAAELENLLCRLVAEPALLRAARKRSLARALTFSAPRMADAYLALYSRLAETMAPAAEKEAIAHAV